MTSEKSPGANRAARSATGAIARWLSVIKISHRLKIRQNNFLDNQGRLAWAFTSRGKRDLVGPQSPICQQAFDTCPLQSLLFPQLQRPVHDLMKILFLGGTGNISAECAALLHKRG